MTQQFGVAPKRKKGSVRIEFRFGGFLPAADGLLGPAELLGDLLDGVPEFGDTPEGRLALWQVLARTIDQGSRLSAVRLARERETDFLQLGDFNENDLYDNLDWIAENQARITAPAYTEDLLNFPSSTRLQPNEARAGLAAAAGMNEKRTVYTVDGILRIIPGWIDKKHQNHYPATVLRFVTVKKQNAQTGIL